MDIKLSSIEKTNDNSKACDLYINILKNGNYNFENKITIIVSDSADISVVFQDNSITTIEKNSVFIFDYMIDSKSGKITKRINSNTSDIRKLLFDEVIHIFLGTEMEGIPTKEMKIYAATNFDNEIIPHLSESDIISILGGEIYSKRPINNIFDRIVKNWGWTETVRDALIKIQNNIETKFKNINLELFNKTKIIKHEVKEPSYIIKSKLDDIQRQKDLVYRTFGEDKLKKLW